MLYQNLQLRQCGLTVLWCAGGIVKEECLLVLFFVILDLKEQGPRDQKRTLYLILQSGQSGFDGFCGMLAEFQRVVSAGVAFCHPKLEKTKPARSKKHAVSSFAVGADRFLTVLWYAGWC